MTSSERRPLTGDERRLLDALLAHDFPGVAELRVQARDVTASRGCDCGCGTIELHVPPGAPSSSAANPAPVEGDVRDVRGGTVGGLLLFVSDGRLGALEVYSLLDDPLPLPALEQVSWVGTG